MPLRLDLLSFKPDACELIGHPVGRLCGVGIVSAIRADAGDFEQFKQVRLEVGSVSLNVFVNLGGCFAHETSSFRRALK